MRFSNVLNTKINCHAIWLALLVFTGQSYLYLFDTSVLVMGVPAADLPLAVACIWGVITWFALKDKPSPPFRFGALLVAPLLLSLMSANQATQLFGQSFTAGFLVQRQFYVWAFLYFPVRKLIACGELSVKGVFDVLAVMTVAELILFIGNYFAGGALLVVGTGTRYDGDRYYYNPVLLDMALLFCLSQLFLDRTKRAIPLAVCLFIVVAVLFEVVVVQKFRLTSTGLVGCVVIAVVLAKTGVERRLVAVIVALCFVLIVSNTEMFQDVLKAITQGDTNLTVRETGRELYFSGLAKHPILGCGIVHESSVLASEAAGVNRDIFFVDNGVPALMYIYGGLGLLWIVLIWLKMLRLGWSLNVKGFGSFYLLVPLFFVITAINEAHWYWYSGFELLVLFIVLMESRFDTISHVSGDQVEASSRITALPWGRKYYRHSSCAS